MSATTAAKDAVGLRKRANGIGRPVRFGPATTPRAALADYTIGAQLLNFICVISRSREHLVIVLAKRGSASSA